MFGLIILGSGGKTTTVGVGQFYCPQCRAQRPYERKRLSRYFTLYFIPVFPIEKLGEFVECQACHSAFDLSILQSPAPDQAQNVIEGLRADLKLGHSVQNIVDRLLQSGSSKEEAAWAVYFAGNRRFLACENCHLLYDGSLVYCGNCGHRLVPFQGRLDTGGPE